MEVWRSFCSGCDEEIDAFVERIDRGPSYASITKTEIEELPFKPFNNFEIRVLRFRFVPILLGTSSQTPQRNCSGPQPFSCSSRPESFRSFLSIFS